MFGIGYVEIFINIIVIYYFLDQVFQKHLEGVPEGEFYAFVLDPNKGLDIDHPSDLILAEALLSTREIPSL